MAIETNVRLTRLRSGRFRMTVSGEKVAGATAIEVLSEQGEQVVLIKIPARFVDFDVQK